ncbi:DUF5008 domain-containing protein [Mucilaginibacter gynuensis]
MRKLKFIITIIALSTVAIQGCKKEQTTFEDPYADAKSPLGIEINRSLAPVPANGESGTVVTFQARGLKQYEGKLKFMFNGEEGEVTEVTESTIKVKVPDAGSTGVTSISVSDQLVIGPIFTVNGLVNIDPSFRATAGTNGVVNQAYPLADGRYFVIGGFNNYDNKGTTTPLNRIVRVSADFEFDRTFRTGKGANGQLSKIIEISNNKYVISGGFSGYGGRPDNISNITTLNINGSIDTMGIKTYRRPGLLDTIKFFPRFNGGTNEYIDKIYKHQNKILATGRFRYYVTRTYTEASYDFQRDTVILDSTEIRQIVRFNLDGSLDKSFRFNATTNKGLPAANGPIDSYMHTTGALNEKLVIFGNFTTFDSSPANRLVRLNVDGGIDNTFNVGSGTDNSINYLTYNSVTKKYLITGAFRSYNGKPALGIALLNEDGTLDESFQAKSYEGGFYGFSKQLDNGWIVVSGSFKKYNNVTRSGFMIIDNKGDFVPKYNATGPFGGYLTDIVETKSADGKKALLLLGGYYRFDNLPVYNITRVTIE